MASEKNATSDDFGMVMPDGRFVWFRDMNEAELRQCVRWLRSHSEYQKQSIHDALELARCANKRRTSWWPVW